MDAQQLTAVQLFAVWVLPVLFAITVHEVAHGYVAYLFGDKTAFILGRLTLNPIKHIDILGTIIVPAILLYLGGFIFGWAKPVPISDRNFRHPKRDMALVGIAGPFANLIMALIWAGIAKLGLIALQHGFIWAFAFVYMGKAGIAINLILMVLNLIPLPPLDGSHLLMWILPNKWAAVFTKIAPFGFFILLFFLATGLLGLILSPVVTILHGTIVTLFGI